MYITLPSNVIEREYPDNKNESYTTVLPEILRLTPGDFEVGLREIQYTTSWNNISGSSLEFRLAKEGGETETKKLQI